MSKVTGKYIDESIFKINTAAGDSSTTVFNLIDTPISAGNLQVFINGLSRDITTDYTVSGAAITFLVAPVTGQKIKFIYIKK